MTLSNEAWQSNRGKIELNGRQTQESDHEQSLEKEKKRMEKALVKTFKRHWIVLCSNNGRFYAKLRHFISVLVSNGSFHCSCAADTMDTIVSFFLHFFSCAVHFQMWRTCSTTIHWCQSAYFLTIIKNLIFNRCSIRLHDFILASLLAPNNRARCAGSVRWSWR